VIFVEAFSHGLRAVLAAMVEPDALAAIRLTLVVALVSVPLNTVCGVAGAWCIGRFRSLAAAFDDVDRAAFSVSPVISGLVWVLLFGANGWLGRCSSGPACRSSSRFPG